jgi:hypothetical protein
MAETEKPVEKPTKEALEDLYPDVDMPHLQTVIQLLYHTGYEIDDIESMDATPYVRVYVGGEEWFIMSDTEADEYAEEDAENLFDEMEMDALPGDWPDFIMNKDDFDSALAEAIQNYIETAREEPSNDPTTYDSKLDEEMAGANTASEQDFEDYLTTQWVPDGDVIQWFISEYGHEAFKETANVDTAALAKHIMETDGRGSIISDYNGEEIDLGKGYYAYRLA